MPDTTGFTEFYYYFLISDIYKWTYFGLRFPLFPRIRNGKKKGSLAKAMNEALEEWLKSYNNDTPKENLKVLERGIAMKKWEFNREDLHGR